MKKTCFNAETNDFDQRTACAGQNTQQLYVGGLQITTRITGFR